MAISVSIGFTVVSAKGLLNKAREAFILTATNWVVLFAGFPVHQVDIWWPPGGL